MAVAAAALAIGCGGSAFGGPTSTGKRYEREQARATLARTEQPGLVLGEYALADNAVVDGDTIKVVGLETSLRLLAIDTEEKFFNKDDRRQLDRGWDSYLAYKRGDSKKPVKMATPLGLEATRWAEQFFDGVERVRLERDHPKELRGTFGRYLTYAFAYKDGKWVNYNVECVRAGMSPYFTKYGYSRRFHAEFVAAQAEARAARRGIWDPAKQHYPDYDERLHWWNARADFLAAFEKEAEGRDDYIVLTHYDAMKRLEENLGKPVVIIGVVGNIRLGDRGPTKVMLSRRLHNDFPLIFFDKDVFRSAGVERWRGEFVRAQGAVNKYYNKYRKQHELQIIVNLPSHVRGPEAMPWVAHD